MAPAFSNVSIRDFTTIFFDSAYKVKDAWDNLLLSSPNGDALIEVQTWMNHISLDSIGIAGFSHDFGSLTGKHSEMVDILDAFTSSSPASASDALVFVSQFLPVFKKIPTARHGMNKRLNKIMGDIAEELLRRTEQEKQSIGDFKYSAGQSIIGALSELQTHNNVQCQILIVYRSQG